MPPSWYVINVGRVVGIAADHLARVLGALLRSA